MMWLISYETPLLNGNEVRFRLPQQVTMDHARAKKK